MKTLYLVGAIIFILLSVICIGHTVFEMCTGKYLIWTANYWGSVAFHAVTGIIGIFLLTKVVPYKGDKDDKEEKGEPSILDKIEKMSDKLDGDKGFLESIGEEIKKEENKSGKDGGEKS
ncbi:MAG: hypothetical protein K8T10_12295 [Candidatus Eremiobacteraeota bacterium]|nr:hypothetical protein [Candidatus Eremiobacteraeota bacterium]